MIYLAWWGSIAKIDGINGDGAGQNGGNESKEPLHGECVG